MDIPILIEQWEDKQGQRKLWQYNLSLIAGDAEAQQMAVIMKQNSTS